ncbi:PH domain-containing protein [Bacteroides sp. OttesenSCG-928-E20]|nr:PH domain-containing protein [Bacteroides sp. OttesenSCG-928-N06]MDL2299767.1 PH domain-containing protein [Bacteroides sp. OttesenSCG-928-E20]
MKRIFHSRIIWYQYVYLILLGLLAFWLLWTKTIVPAALCLLFVVFLIERFIHTTYTITPADELIIYPGRFGKSRTIKLKDIRTVEKRQSPLGKLTHTGYILIGYGNNRYISLLPIKEREFIDLLEQRLHIN